MSPEAASIISANDGGAAGDGEDEEEWLVEGLIPKRGLTILGGNPKTGKTLFVLDLWLAVSTGRPFFGRDTAPAEGKRGGHRMVVTHPVPQP